MSTLLSRLYNFVLDKANQVKITASRVDGELDQLITAVNRKVLCSASAPSSPIAGQTWIDTTNKFLKMYRNNEWVIISVVHVGTSAPSTVQEGDLWYDTTNNMLKTYDGSSWTQAGVAINGLTEKTALVDADLFLIEDSEASNAQKKVQASNIGVYINSELTEKIIKAWVSITYSSGIPTLNDNYNVSSITDNGVGDITIAWDTDFASANYAVVATAGKSPTGELIASQITVATGSVQLLIKDKNGDATDPDFLHSIAIGDQ